MTRLDYWVLLGYFVVSIGIGVWFLHKVAGKMKSLSQFFLSGRSLPWWLLGTSMVATTFAADTPILASRMVAEFGLYFSWMVLPQPSHVFFIGCPPLSCRSGLSPRFQRRCWP